MPLFYPTLFQKKNIRGTDSKILLEYDEHKAYKLPQYPLYSPGLYNRGHTETTSDCSQLKNTRTLRNVRQRGVP